MSAGGRQSLLRLYKSMPLPKINNFRIELSSSLLLPPIHVHLLPQWRDDGHVTLEQVLPPLPTSTDSTTIKKNYSDMTQQVDWNIDIQDSHHSDETMKDVAISIDYLHPPSETNSTTTTTASTSTNTNTNTTNPSLYSSGDIQAHMLGEEGEDDTDIDLSSFSDLNVKNNDGSSRPLPSITILAKLPERMTNLECDLRNPIDIDGNNNNNNNNNNQQHHHNKLSLLDSTIGKSAKKFQILESIQFYTNGGNIQFQGCTVRANDININANGGIIHVGKTMEAQKLQLQTTTDGGRIRCQKINASSCSISITNNHNNHSTTNPKPPTTTKNDDNHDDDDDDDVKLLDKDDEGAMIDISSLYTTNTGTGADLYIEDNDNNNNNNHHPNSYYPYSHVRVKSNHGHISVDTTYNNNNHNTIGNNSSNNNNNNNNDKKKKPIVDLGGINGSFDVSIASSSTTNPNNNNGNNDDDDESLVAAQIHVDSLAPQSMSILTSDVGNVNMTIDRKIHSDVRFLSCPYISQLDPELLLSSPNNDDDEEDNTIVNAISSISSNHNDNKHDTTERSATTTTTTSTPTQSWKEDTEIEQQKQKIQIHTNAFTGHTIWNSPIHDGCYVEGQMENKSQEPSSRFEEFNKNTTNINNSGKIRLQGAADQALHGFSSTTTTNNNNNNNNKEVILPLMAIGTHGKIQVETVSWLGAIARRYGLNEDIHQPSLGRQAKAGNPSLREEKKE